ncbi:hypothetical protein ACLB2K_008869 [Fragaria x ananassa]
METSRGRTVGAYKLNVDAAFSPTQTRGGVGSVITDSSGTFVAAFMRPTASPKQCELMATREGLDSLQYHKVTIKSDSTEASLR